MTQLDCSRKWGEKKTKANAEIQTVQPALDILDLPKKRSGFLRNRLRKSQSAVMSWRRPVALRRLGGWTGPSSTFSRVTSAASRWHTAGGPGSAEEEKSPTLSVAHAERNKTKTT